MALLSILEMHAHTVSRLRRDLRVLCDDSPSPQAWLMAARTEAQLAGSAHRVQVNLLSSSVGSKAVTGDLERSGCLYPNPRLGF